MKVAIADYNGMRIAIYVMDAGEMLPWHTHAWDHGHVVVSGRTSVEIRGEPATECLPGMEMINVPASVEHQITALEASTFLQPFSLEGLL